MAKQSKRANNVKFQAGRRKKGEKRSHPRGGGFGFTKSKQIKEFEGAIPRHGSPKRSTINLDHDSHEEVFIVSEKPSDQEPRVNTFNQLSSISVTNLTSTAAVLEDVDSEQLGDLGFFIDSTPASVSVDEIPEIEPPQTTINHQQKMSSYQQKKKKILQDDSVYIESDEEDLLLDDGASVSSSEDIEMLQALSHWGKSDIMQFDQPVKRTTDEDDYAMLESATLNDICDSDDEGIDDEDDTILLDPSLNFDELEHVPESMKNSYRGIIQQEKSRLKRQAKNQRKMNQRLKNMERNQKITEKSHLKKRNILDQVLHEFIRKDHIKTYRLTNLTYHGRAMIVPKIAKLFQLDISEIESNKKNIQLVKTSKTCIPLSYQQHIEKEEKIMSKLKKTPINRPARFRNKEDFKNNALHGKEVASGSVPISSSNIGHRMLAAMGWKQGDAIGSKEDGIKEPVKVFMRANRRGLGA